MASTYTPLGVELMATGENAGTWGTKTNANLNLVSQLTGGFAQVSIAGGAGTTALDVDDGALTGTAQQRMIEFTGSITGNRIVTIPNDVETFYILKNATSGAYTVQFKYATGSGGTFTFATTNKGTAIVFATANDGTNPDIVEVQTGGDVVDDTSPQLGGNLDTNDFNIAFDDAHGIIDENGNEQLIFQTTGSAVNQLDITNAATGNPPKISATGGDSNIDLDLAAKGTGHLTVRGNTNSGAIQFNCELNSHGQIVIAQPHSAGVTNTLTLPAGASSTLVSLVSTDILTNKTLTSPKIGTSILDTNGNELFKLTATGSAVNELTYANAATGNKPAFTATGGDTNIGVSIQPKGSGTVTIDALTFPAADGSADQVLKTDGSGTLSFTDVSGGTSWQAVKTSGFTAVAGEGYFINTTGGTITMTLPSSPSIGDEVSFVDYAGTFDSNTMTVGRNSQKINGATADLTVSVERAANTLVYTDGTQGWLLKNK